MTSVPVPWNFWLPDEDRSTGWTSHGYVLQFVCQGYGSSPAAAWEDAVDRGKIPDDLALPDRVVAIREDAERELVVGEPSQRA